jgi:hypothetical protein
MAELHEFQKLEQALIEAGRAIDYPATPDLAARVRTGLHGELRRERPRLFDRPVRRWRPAFVVALAILAAIALLLIIPETREVIAQWLGLRTIRIIETTPTPPGAIPVTATSAAATPSPSPTPGVVPFKQCCPATLEEARQKARFKILLPPDEQPTRVFLQDQVFGRGSAPQQVVLVFGDPDRPRVVLYQASRMLYSKLLSHNGLEAGTVITETQVNRQRALWLTGAPHVLVTLDRNGQPLLDFERPVNANTLIWETGDFDAAVTYRLETALSLEEAMAFAESLR